MLLSEAFQIFETNVLMYENRKPKTIRNYRSGRSSIVNAIGDVPVELISMDTVVRWKFEMERKGNSQSSMKASLLMLRSLLKWLKSHGVKVMEPSDITMPKVARNKHTWLDYDEVRQIINAAKNPRDKAIIACLFSTGCRISELLNLNVEDVAESDTPTVCGKGDKYREVYIDVKARELLNEYLATRKDKYKPLFMSGQRARITVQRVEQIIHECAHEAGIDKRVTPHVFRHSNITDYILNGAPMAVVQKIAGHKNIQTTIDIYSHIQDRDKRRVFNQFHSK